MDVKFNRKYIYCGEEKSSVTCKSLVVTGPSDDLVGGFEILYKLEDGRTGSAVTTKENLIEYYRLENLVLENK